MKYLETRNEYKEEIDKSKFISIIFNIHSIDDFKGNLKQIQKEYPKATHYCYAYSFDDYKKSNDDGEPGGTAGMPILNAIIQNDINNVGIVVVRYFGGIKLGAGGLTRAYRTLADQAVKTAQLYELIDKKRYELTYDYSFNNQIEYYVNTHREINNLDVIYDEKITRIIATNEPISDFINLCNGQIEINEDGTYQLKKMIK